MFGARDKGDYMIYLLLLVLMTADCLGVENKLKLTLFFCNNDEATEGFTFDWDDNKDKTVLIQLSETDYNSLKNTKMQNFLVPRKEDVEGKYCARSVDGKMQSFNANCLLLPLLPRTQPPKFNNDNFKELQELRKFRSNSNLYKNISAVLTCAMVGFAGLSAYLWWRK